jgi:hypothetical protein
MGSFWRLREPTSLELLFDEYYALWEQATEFWHCQNREFTWDGGLRYRCLDTQIFLQSVLPYFCMELLLLGVGYAIWWLYTNRRGVYSWVQHHGQEVLPLSADLVKNLFRERRPPAVNTSNPTHTHPNRAAWRSTATVFAQDLASNLGCGVFVYQGSKTDGRNQLRYNREHYWVKDTTVTPSMAVPNKFDLRVIVDVDYYMDMPDFLSRNDHPVLLYTFQPTSAAHDDGDFSFRFDSDNQVHYSVSGAASYVHPVWNYSADVILCSNWWSSTAYLVDRKAANVHHEYVLLVPIARWKGIFSWLTRFMSSDKFDRLRPFSQGWVTLEKQGRNGRTVSLAKADQFTPVEVSREVLDTLRCTVANSTQHIQISTVQATVQDRGQSQIVTDYLRSTSPSPVPLISPAIDGLTSYQFTNHTNPYDQEAANLVQSYMSPLMNAAFAPRALKLMLSAHWWPGNSARPSSFRLLSQPRLDFQIELLT